MKYIEGTKLEDLTGKQFNMLKVIKLDHIEYSNSHKQNMAYWLCECQCEDKNTKIINSYNLKNGFVKSCGCLRKKMIKEKRRKQNKYEFYEDYIIGYACNDNFPFKFDLDDYDKVKEYYWYHEKHGYFISPRRDGSNKKSKIA